MYFHKGEAGASLMVQWLRFWAPNAGNPGSIPGQGTWSHMSQLRPGTIKWKKNLIDEAVKVIFSKEKRGKGKFDTRYGNVTMEAETGGKWSQVKECWKPPETGRGKNRYPLVFQRKCDPADTVMWAQWFQPETCGLRNGERVNLLWFKLPSLWSFVPAT